MKEEIRPFWAKKQKHHSAVWRFFHTILQLIRAITNPLLGRLAARQVVPARQKKMAFLKPIAGKKRKAGEYTREQISKDIDAHLRHLASCYHIEPDEMDISHLMVRSPDKKSTLDTLQIKPTGWDELPPEQRYATLIFHGNTTRFEFDHALGRVFTECITNNDTLDKNRLVVTCNYDNVGFSKGPDNNLHTTLRSTLSQLKRLLEMGIPAENIMVRGHSFGGIVTQNMLAKAHEYGYKIRACIDRTGPSISEIVVGFVWQAFDKIGMPWLGKLLGEILRPFIWLILKVGNHEKAVGEAYLKVDPQYSHIATLRADKLHREHLAQEKNNHDDRVIVHQASLWRFSRNRRQGDLKYSRVEFKRRIDMILCYLEPERDQKLIDKLEHWKVQFRRHKYYYPENTERSLVMNRDGHCRSSWNIVNRYNGNTLQRDYRQFRDRTTELPDRKAQEAEIDRLYELYVPKDLRLSYCPARAR